MAAAALEALNGVDLFGSRGGPDSKIYVVPDEIVRNLTILHVRLCYFSCLFVFPSFCGPSVIVAVLLAKRIELQGSGCGIALCAGLSSIRSHRQSTDQKYVQARSCQRNSQLALSFSSFFLTGFSFSLIII